MELLADWLQQVGFAFGLLRRGSWAASLDEDDISDAGISDAGTRPATAVAGNQQRGRAHGPKIALSGDAEKYKRAGVPKKSY